LGAPEYSIVKPKNSNNKKRKRWNLNKMNKKSWRCGVEWTVTQMAMAAAIITATL
jgi:hypothetical protein